MTQAAPIIATGLELLEAGPFTLTNAGNNVATLAGNVTGAASYSDLDALTIGTVNSIGLTSTATTLSLQTGGLLTRSAAAEPDRT